MAPTRCIATACYYLLLFVVFNNNKRYFPFWSLFVGPHVLVQPNWPPWRDLRLMVSGPANICRSSDTFCRCSSRHLNCRQLTLPPPPLASNAPCRFCESLTIQSGGGGAG